MCDTCFNIDKRKYRYQLSCKDKSCDGIMVEIDELFLLPISILNKKGYFKKFCCSGHLLDSCCDAYISFEEDIVLPNLPLEFDYDANRWHHIYKDSEFNGFETIRTEFYKDKELSDKYKKILKASENLLIWAEQLPNNYDLY